MRREFKRNIDSLEAIFAFLDKFSAKHMLDGSISFAINLAVEELFSNMVKYSANSPHDILIHLSRDANKVIVTLTEYDVESYDIKITKEYDPTQPLEDRKLGGVGIHLVKQFIDEIQYEYQDGKSTIILFKYLENYHARDKNEQSKRN